MRTSHHEPTVADAAVVDGPVTRWVAVASQRPDGGCSGTYELIAAAGVERRESLRHPPGAGGTGAVRCCGLLPLRQGVLVIGCVMLTAQLLLTAAGATLYCLVGKMIRQELYPLLRYLNETSHEEHVALMEYVDEHVAELERALLVVTALGVVGVGTCALLVYAARRRRSPPALFLLWLVWHGCVLVLGSAASAGGLVFGLMNGEESWIGCAVAGLVLAPGVWYWFVQVFVFYLSVRKRRHVGGRYEAVAKLAPLPKNDRM